MPERIHIPAARVADVAAAALVCRQTVVRYRAGLHLLRATEAAITKAARGLPEDKQMDIPLDNPPERKRTRITARNGTVFDLPPEFEPPGNPPAARAQAKRCRVTCLLVDEKGNEVKP